jgi:HK97 family phage major capsid protein
MAKMLFSDRNMLSHFFFYQIDGILELHDLFPEKGLRDIAYDLVMKEERFLPNRTPFLIPAFKDLPWICSPGQAQAAICFHKLGMERRFKMAMDGMKLLQNPSGGFWVEPQTSGRIITQFRETSPVRQIFGTESISSDQLILAVDRDEASVAWASEQGTRSETNTPAIGEKRISVHEIYAKPKASQQALEDMAVNVEQWLANKVVDKFSRAMNTAYIVGSGTGQPRGLLTQTFAEDSGSGVSWGSIGFVKTGVNGDFAASNKGDILFSVEDLLKTGYRSGASFLMNRRVLTSVRKFKGSDNNYLFQPGLQAGVPSQLIGYPIVLAEDMPTLATNSYSIAFGNFKLAYLIVDRVGISTLRDPYSAKPFVEFYTRARTGGDVVDYEAFKCIKFAA